MASRLKNSFCFQAKQISKIKDIGIKQYLLNFGNKGIGGPKNI
jgi:hypothetical protein